MGSTARPPECGLPTNSSPRDEDPSWLKPWGDYLDFVATAKRTAPEAIRAPWQTYGGQIEAQTAVFEKYGYDMRAAEEKATADEKKVFEEPGEEAQAAFREILTFEALTCDAGQPPAAGVDFSGEKPGALRRWRRLGQGAPGVAAD